MTDSVPGVVGQATLDAALMRLLYDEHRCQVATLDTARTAECAESDEVNTVRNRL
jgi:hypothetical protein